MSSPNPAVVCSGLSFAWPDGRPVFTDLDVAFAPGRTGLVGRNGGGKSTLLRLIAGPLRPGAGTIVSTGEVAYLPQDLILRTARTVADLLGVSATVAALRAIEAGDTDPAQFATLADDWDVENRARAALERVGFDPGGADALDRPVSTLSGGEAVLTGLAGLLLARAPISLLDEPSNNLDRRARAVLEDVIEQWPGVLIVASHDRDLLERVDQIVELHGGTARTFGGPWSAYAAAIEAEQHAAARQVRAAEGELAREKRQLVETQVKLAQRRRFADKAFREKREPRIAMNAKKRKAQVSAAKYRETSQGRLQDARSSLAEAEDLVRERTGFASTCPRPPCRPGATSCTSAPWSCAAPNASRCSGPTGRVRRPCSVPWPDSRRTRGSPSRRRPCPPATCRSAWICWTTSAACSTTSGPAHRPRPRTRCGPGWPASWCAATGWTNWSVPSRAGSACAWPWPGCC